MSRNPGDRFPNMDMLLEALAYDPRRRWARAGIPAAVALLVAGTVLFLNARASRQERACADSVVPKLVGTWDAERKQAIFRAFTATGQPNAEVAWQSVERTLDAYASAWTSMHMEACNGTFVRRDQSPELFDLRVACLNERLAELRAATSLFCTADARIVDNAPLAAEALTPVASCGDARALRAIVPPPPQVAAHVAALRQDLARAKVMRDTGKLADARALLGRLAGESKATGYGPLESLVLLQLGDVVLAGGDAADADAILARAALLADTARDDVTRVRALTRQLYAVGYILEEFDRVESLAGQTSSVIERLGGDLELEGDRWQALGMISLAQRNLPVAFEQLSRAITVRERQFGRRGRRVAMSRHSRCLVLVEEGELAAALDECRLALGIWTEALGPKHPEVSLALKNMGRIEFKLGRVDDGCREIEEALAIEEASLEKDHPSLATTLLSLGECRSSRGDHTGALELELRALEIRQKKLGRSHSKTGEALAAV
jgi:tetratricopeptide (TPR) repeat protein